MQHIGFIKIYESNFLTKGSQVRFESGNFYYFDTKFSETRLTILGESISSMNKASIRRIGTSGGSPFSNLFKGGLYIAIFMEILEFAQLKTGKQRLSIHFDDGKYFTGFTDLETFFKVQDVWIEHK